MNEFVNKVWDVIVIGTGIGGATAGRALAEKGKSVLFIEKGRQGFRSERSGINTPYTDPVARSVRGLWPDQVESIVNGVPRAFFPPLGSGAGGSSAFYAGTLERPEPHDLDDTSECPHPTGGWPISYHEMRKWFELAESQYCVKGAPYPCDVPPSEKDGLRRPATSGDKAIVEQLRRNGLSPYELRTSIRYLPGCYECVGFKCPRSCKMDGRSAGLEPALATGRSTLLDRCEVVALAGTAGHISHVKVLREGLQAELRARQFILAAGALSSPRLLLASRTEYWPNGCANSNDQVGRNLMFHLNEVFAIWPPYSGITREVSKSVGVRDLYMLNGDRMGMVQAMGISVSYGEIAYFLKDRLENSALRSFAPFAPAAARVASSIMGNAKLFVGLLEDLPYEDNRVVLDPTDPSTIRFQYTFQPELLQRRKAFRKAIKHSFRGMRPIFVSWRPELNYGHPCGTLRSGVNPKQSVLNSDCRTHDVNNLYVTDASFFPTSTGVNPSLTIAANAIRVANLISQTL